MKWRLETRQGKAIAGGTLEQMLTYLKYLVRDGEYSLVGWGMTVSVRRHRGKVYPFDEWEGWQPLEDVKRWPLTP